MRKELIESIVAYYMRALLFCWRKNKYGHPNKEVLDNLKKSKIYRTDIDGSIMFKIKNNKLLIKTGNA